MTIASVVTSTGVVVRLDEDEEGPIVVCDLRHAPLGLRHHEVGRVVHGGFQPHPSAMAGLRPATLRAIADLIDLTYAEEKTRA